MFMELELMNDGAFLSKMLATQLDRLDFISDIPVLDGDGKDIVLKSYEIELKDVIFAYDSRPVLDGITLKSHRTLLVLSLAVRFRENNFV